MAETWDELCEEFDEALSMQEYVVPKSLIDRWNKVKAEGDKLRALGNHFERISNWNFFYSQKEDHRFRPENSVIIDKKAYNDAYKKFGEATDKLEDVRTWYVKVTKGLDMKKVNSWIILPDEIEELRVLLEGE